ncbi:MULTISPECIES: DUF5707 domain-containing protein [unclassified Streptomyces]|uniref:DUF5707 domain-containing protein n=1 Tax=unclassified Streptomyces TaxID=2593676 RepID=UPI00364DE623
MSRRIALSVAAGVVVLGGAGALAFASGEDKAPTLQDSSARYTAPAGDRNGSFTFTTDVEAASGVKSLKVLPWPADSDFADKGLTEKEMAATEVESASCEPAGGKTVRCTYVSEISRTEAAPERGSWYVSVLATAKDGTTTLDTKAAEFAVK